MDNNGSPKPIFDTDESTYVLVTLPVHEGVQSTYQNEGNVATSIKGDRLNEGINIGLIDGVSDGVKKELVKVVLTVLKNEGVKSESIVEQTSKGISTVERYISILRKINFIELRGSKKTGGYYLTEIAKEKLKIL